jgi:radical SAM superfamily enzyme YgiQ (UPF0313 family)
MKVLLANPPKPKKSNIQTFYPSLGLLYLASYVETYSDINNLEIIYLEGNVYDQEQFIDRIIKINPDIVGLSIATVNSLVAYDTINRLKSELENVRVICGGPHVTAIPFDVLKKSKADVCVIGEGEVTFQKLLEAYEENKKQSDIGGIAFRKNGSMFLTPDRDLIKDLDSIPFPAWDKAHLKDYAGPQLRKAWPDVCMLSTRGCPYNCTFCSNPVWKHCKPWIRLRSPKNVAKEVSYLANLGAKEIYDFADEFNANLEWSVKVAEEISHVNEDIFFKVQLRADKITEELTSSLKKMGCWLAFVGIESGNQEVLDGVNKKIRLEQVVKGLRLLKKYNIKAHGYFMIFNVWEENGELKFENPKMCERTLRFARELISGGLLDNISWSIATPEPGSQLYDISLRHELIDENTYFSDMSGDKILMRLPGISRRDISWIKFKGMTLQLYCSIFHGDINWGNRSYLTQKVRTLVDYGLSSMFSR